MLKRILAIVGWLGTALVFGALLVRLFKPEWAQYGQYAAMAGLVCVVVYLLGQWKEAAASMSHRQTRLSTIAIGSVILVFGVLVAINYLASRRNYRWDLTANQQFTLSPQTRQILEKLDAPITMRVFDKPAEFDRFRDKLDQYTYLSKKVSVEYIDVDRHPVQATQAKVQAYGTVVIDYKGRTERVTGNDEAQISNGLIKVITGEQRKVYFLTGHGEKDTAGTERNGYSSIAATIGSENFKLETLVLLQQQTVPADATVVVVAGPTADLFPPEVDALRKYLAGGGKLLLMLDPIDKAGALPLTNLIALAKEWGIDVGNNIVVDVSGVGQLIGTDESVPVVASYPAHPITQNFKLLTAYPFARSVSAASAGANGRNAQNFIESSKQSWGETNLDEMLKTGKVQNDKDVDLQGPVPLGAAAAEPIQPKAEATPAKDAGDAPKKEARIAVIGDSDFAANFALGIQGNRDMFMNVVNWLAQQENLISIRPKDPDDRRITLTEYQQKGIMLFALLLLPASIFGAGVYAWTRRRK